MQGSKTMKTYPYQNKKNDQPTDWHHRTEFSDALLNIRIVSEMLVFRGGFQGLQPWKFRDFSSIFKNSAWIRTLKGPEQGL